MIVDRFQMGDVVWLRIGGPRMIVGGHGQQDGSVVFHCYRTVGAEVRHMALPGGILTKAEPPPLCGENSPAPTGEFAPS